MTGGTTHAGRAAVGACALALIACAPTFPSFAGGRTTPRGRTDLALGAAVRVPVGDLADEPALVPVESGGVAPGASVRHGLTRDIDLGLEVSGTALRGHLRLQLGSGMVHLVTGLAPHVGLGHQDGELIRLGGTIPIVLAVDVLSIYEIWIGLQLGLEHLTGQAGTDSISMTALRTGGVVGLAVGFRRVHVLVELAIDHELWTGSITDTQIERNGLVLTPALAVRLRL